MLELVAAEVPTTRDHVEHELLRVRGEIEIRELYFARLAGALSAMDLAEDDESDQSTIDWLRHNCRLTQQAAADRVHIGEKLPDMPLTENALYTGEVGIQHLAVTARTAIAVRAAFDEKKLLPAAKRLSPGKFYHESLHYRHAMIPKAVASEQAGMADSRCLSMSTAEDGCLVLQGVLDPIGGAALRTALEPLAQPMGKSDYRGRPKRLADALVELATAGQSPRANAGHKLGRDAAWFARRSGCGNRVLPPDLCEDSGEMGLRLQHHAGPHAGLSGNRRRSLSTDDQWAQAPRACRARQALPVAGMRAAGFMV